MPSSTHRGMEKTYIAAERGITVLAESSKTDDSMVARSFALEFAALLSGHDECG